MEIYALRFHAGMTGCLFCLETRVYGPGKSEQAGRKIDGKKM
jgi:hypothetical protein